MKGAPDTPFEALPFHLPQILADFQAISEMEQ
jgi:hypothetical protein